MNTNHINTSHMNKNKNKQKLVISFDVETIGDTPASGSCIMIGFVGFLETSIPSMTNKWHIFKSQWCIKEYNVRGEKCMEKFWSKHLDNLKYIENNAQEPSEVAIAISDLLAELSKSYDWYFVADPASFDWAWLSHFYDKFGPTDKTYLDYKVICMDGMVKALNFMGYNVDHISKLTTPPEEYGLKMSHLADDDAEYQAYGYLQLLKQFRELRNLKYNYMVEFWDNSSGICYISIMNYIHLDEALDHIMNSKLVKDCLNHGETSENILTQLKTTGIYPPIDSPYEVHVENSSYRLYIRKYGQMSE